MQWYTIQKWNDKTTDILNNVDKSNQYNVEQKKWDPKEYTLYESSYRK